MGEPLNRLSFFLQYSRQVELFFYLCRPTVRRAALYKPARSLPDALDTIHACYVELLKTSSWHCPQDPPPLIGSYYIPFRWSSVRHSLADVDMNVTQTHVKGWLDVFFLPLLNDQELSVDSRTRLNNRLRLLRRLEQGLRSVQWLAQGI